MGLFDWLFKKKDAVKKQVSHQEQWEFYFCNIEHKLASVYVDLGLAESAPFESKSELFWVSIKMNVPKEDGLSSEEEAKSLWMIEDLLVNKFVNKHDAIYAGRTTSDGFRTLYFYLENRLDCEKTIATLMENFSQYAYDCGSKTDKGWNVYFNFFYPSPRDLQRIGNRRDIEQLEKNGDNLTKEREVFHWLYFKTESDRANFLKKIENDNFTVVAEFLSQASDNEKVKSEFIYGLQIKRKDKVDYENADKYLIYLWELAADCNGQYDGWETSVEKEISLGTV